MAEFAFSSAEPPTDGSTRGTTPRSAAVVGRVGSPQIVGMLTTNGLKFCSAPARPLAAAMTCDAVPSSETIKSACESWNLVSFVGVKEDLRPHLVTWIGRCEESADGISSESGGLSRLSEIRQSLDSRNWDLFLAKTILISRYSHSNRCRLTGLRPEPVGPREEQLGRTFSKI